MVAPVVTVKYKTANMAARNFFILLLIQKYSYFIQRFIKFSQIHSLFIKHGKTEIITVPFFLLYNPPFQQVTLLRLHLNSHFLL